ncbi:MAG: hypothetical protein IKJ68_12550 [Clostridia bacterium]|nr:hypothetical protein [Clostridia bacterium]
MKKDIKDEVLNLSESKMKMILKIGKVYIWLLAIVAIPVFAYSILNIIRVLDVSENQSIANTLLKNNMIALCILLIYFVVSLIFVRVKFPFYSDKKYKYLKKNKNIIKDAENY